MKQNVVSLLLLLSCFSLKAMEVGQGNTILCMEFWKPRIEHSNKEATTTLENMNIETEESKTKALNSLWIKQLIRVNKQEEALKCCIREGVHASMEKYGKWF